MTEFDPLYSTDNIWRGDNMSQCLTDDLDEIEADIADLETNKAPTTHTHSEYASASHEHSGYATTSHTHSEYASASHTHDYASTSHTHSEYASTSHTHSGFATESHTHSYNDLSNLPTIPTIPTSLPANGGNSDTVDGLHASDFATASHTHDSAYLAKSLQFTNDLGGVEFSYGADSGKNLLTEIASMGQGVHTIYSIAATSGNPTTSESWRCFVHKSATNFGWVVAYGSTGSVYSNYLDNGTWMGWRTIYEPNPEALWTGSWYMNASQEVVPSKALSECRNGWVLVWSDFNVDTSTAVNSELCTTLIPKRGVDGNKWTGQAFLTVVPAAMTETADAITLKRVQVYDAKLTGHAYNTVAPRNDVILRAVYEF